jgi:hypothetical protein
VEKNKVENWQTGREEIGKSSRGVKTNLILLYLKEFSEVKNQKFPMFFSQCFPTHQLQLNQSHSFLFLSFNVSFFFVHFLIADGSAIFWKDLC